MDASVTKDTDYHGWLKFINGPGFALSAVGVNGKIMSGVAAATSEA